jgi:hypothetical protein
LPSTLEKDFQLGIKSNSELKKKTRRKRRKIKELARAEEEKPEEN